MSSRIPEPPSEYEAEGIPDMDDDLPGLAATGDSGALFEPPHDSPIAAEGFGTTPAEQEQGESLDGRLARELPDVDQVTPDASDTPFDERAGEGVGRIVQPDEGAHEDLDKDMVASDLGTDGGGYTAEEAAMHLEPES